VGLESGLYGLNENNNTIISRTPIQSIVCPNKYAKLIPKASILIQLNANMLV
jgi:hypothetical protein